MSEDKTFTDFMIRCMESEDQITQALVLLRRSNGEMGYRVFNQEVSDTLGMLRFTQLSVEEDLVSGWKSE